VANFCGAQDVNKCKAAQNDHCLDSVTDETYTGRGAQECLDAAAQAVLDDNLNPKEYATIVEFAGACDELLSGDGTDGDACVRDLDCDSVEGFLCVNGECRDPHYVSPGGKCTAENDVCQQDTYCNGQFCVVKQSSGDPCGADMPCLDDFICRLPNEAGDAGAGDAGAGSSEARCFPKVANGAVDANGQEVTCTSNNECQSNLCSKVEDSDTGLCTSLIRLNANAAVCETLR
jgi:hypothetical protein